MNKVLFFLILVLSPIYLSAQGKLSPKTFKGTIPGTIEAPRVNLSNVNSSSLNIGNITQFQLLNIDMASSRLTIIHRDKHTGTLWMRGIPDKVIQTRSSSKEDQAMNYVSEVASLLNLDQDLNDFKIISQHIDDLGQTHTRLRQNYKGIPVYGSEMMVHGKELPDRFNGRLSIITNDIDINPQLSESEAFLIMEKDLPKIDKTWNDPLNIMNMDRQHQELIIYPSESGPILAYEIGYHNTLIDKWQYIINASTGEVIEKYQDICKLHNHSLPREDQDGATTADAPDLFGTTRNINTFEVNDGFYMIDGARSMYDPMNSVMPDEPVGVIWTIDAFNTSPEREDFNYDHVFSPDNSWAGQSTQVSAHFNAGMTYDYFKNTHGRESINGEGGNIISLVNIADSDGSSLANAFWNGLAMFYGNGGNAFEPLAKGLDVAAHEISHGVIQNTANLEYKGESGALNESYADIFGVLVDRDDYLIGEDVVKPEIFPSGALRSLVDPHNGAALNDYNRGFQPKRLSEKFTGTEDNGGVHINSGIPNHAFYLFAEDVGREKAEQVYYRALTTYLLKSSQFIDQRLAVVQSTIDLFGEGTEAQAARSSFDAVEIFDGEGGNYQEDEEINPGSSFLLVSDNSRSNLYLYDEALNLLANPLSSMDHISKPSVRDDGGAVVFVGSDKRMYFILIDWENGTFDAPEVLQDQPIWSNVIISRDGRRIAGIFDDAVPRIWVYDFGLQDGIEFELFNPTFTEGVTTGEVRYPDAMEFDFSGEYIMYDALNEITSNQSGSIEYWDIGFLKVWDNVSDFWSLGSIEKLFSALPEGVSVGNPTFAKNSDYIVAFDVVEGAIADLYGANLQTGELNKLFSNSTLNYPSFNNNDTRIVHDLNLIGNIDLGEFQIDESKINTVPSSETIILAESRWGVWFANGSRDFSSSVDPEIKLDLIQSYPNPTDGDLNISFNSDQGEHAVIEIYGLDGVRVFEQIFNANNGLNQRQINVSNLNNGMYLCRVRSGIKVGSFLFFKQ